MRGLKWQKKVSLLAMQSPPTLSYSKNGTKATQIRLMPPLHQGAGCCYRTRYRSGMERWFHTREVCYHPNLGIQGRGHALPFPKLQWHSTGKTVAGNWRGRCVYSQNSKKSMIQGLLRRGQAGQALTCQLRVSFSRSCSRDICSYSAARQSFPALLPSFANFWAFIRIPESLNSLFYCSKCVILCVYNAFYRYLISTSTFGFDFISYAVTVLVERITEPFSRGPVAPMVTRKFFSSSIPQLPRIHLQLSDTEYTEITLPQLCITESYHDTSSQSAQREVPGVCDSRACFIQVGVVLTVCNFEVRQSILCS